jgi:predicted outer membrane repeat protein
VFILLTLADLQLGASLAIYHKSITTVNNSLFHNIQTDYGVFFLYTFSGIFNLVSSTIEDCQSYQGAAMYFQNMDHSCRITLDNNTFAANVAFQGGALFMKQNLSLYSIGKNTFINNSASLYGSTLATPPVSIVWVTNLSTPGGFQSGDRLPNFAFTVVDLFNTVCHPFSIHEDFFVSEMLFTSLNGTKANAILLPTTQQPLLQGSEYIMFSDSVIVGDPGTHLAHIYSLLKPYQTIQNNLSAQIVIKECQSPRILHLYKGEPFYRCVLRKYKTHNTLHS